MLGVPTTGREDLLKSNEIFNRYALELLGINTDKILGVLSGEKNSVPFETLSELIHADKSLKIYLEHEVVRIRANVVTKEGEIKDHIDMSTDENLMSCQPITEETFSQLLDLVVDFSEVALNAQSKVDGAH